jgi:hypothetical protein
MAHSGTESFSRPLANLSNYTRFDESESDMSGVPLAPDAVLIYEDLSTGMRARHLFECAAPLFPWAPHFTMTMWRFDLLRVAAERELALKAASVAVFVLISAHGSSMLPEYLKLWVKKWLDRKREQPCALVVALDEKSRDSDSASQMISWLQEGAKAKDVAVFPRFGLTPLTEIEAAVEVIPARAQTDFATLHKTQRWPDSHLDWGINE